MCWIPVNLQICFALNLCECHNGCNVESLPCPKVTSQLCIHEQRIRVGTLSPSLSLFLSPSISPSVPSCPLSLSSPASFLNDEDTKKAAKQAYRATNCSLKPKNALSKQCKKKKSYFLPAQSALRCKTGVALKSSSWCLLAHTTKIYN